MWPSNVKKQKQIQNKTKTTTTLIYLIHTHAVSHFSSLNKGLEGVRAGSFKIILAARFVLE